MERTRFASLILFVIFSIVCAQNYTFTYKTVEDLDLQLDVYMPSHPIYEKYPVFFVMHGGAFLQFSKATGLSPLEQAEVLSLGFVYVSVDYRLNPGVLLPDIIQDVQDAYAWVRTELGKLIPIDIDNIVAFGKSAGGGLALISGYMLSPRPVAVIAFYPYCSNFTDPAMYIPGKPVSQSLIDAVNKLKASVISEYNWVNVKNPYEELFWRAYNESKLGWLAVSSDSNATDEQVFEALREYSTVNFVDEDYPPTYLVHGLGDVLVHYNQSSMMADALKFSNVPYELKLVPEVNHSFDDNIINGTDSLLWKEYVLPVFAFAKEVVAKKLNPKKSTHLEGFFGEKKLAWIGLGVLFSSVAILCLFVRKRNQVKSYVAILTSINESRIEEDNHQIEIQ